MLPGNEVNPLAMRAICIPHLSGLNEYCVPLSERLDAVYASS